MKKNFKILIIIALVLTYSCNVITTTNYKNLTNAERSYIQTFNIDSNAKLLDYTGKKWYLQEIKADNLKELYPKFDTTIIFLYKPTCSGYDEYLLKVTKIRQTKNIKIIVISESYYIDILVTNFIESGFNNVAYIIDHSYGNSIVTIKRNFTKNAFGFDKTRSDSSAFVWVNKDGYIIKTSSDL